MQTHRSLTVAIALLLTASGCATIFNGSKERITIEAPSEAEIRVNGQYVGTGTAVTTIKKKGEVLISAALAGCRTHTVPVERTFDPVTLLGLFIDGGLITILIIDGALTGAWSKAVTKYYRMSPQCPPQ